MQTVFDSSSPPTACFPWVWYTALSKALAMTGVILMPRLCEFSLGTSTFGKGLILALFQDVGQEWIAKDKFQMCVMTGVKSSA